MRRSHRSTRTDPSAATDEATRGGSRAKRPEKKKAPQRLPRAERQTLVLAKAANYFAEHGLNAQTRAIAEACGVSQRLLYSLFPSKAALIDAVYKREIEGLFEAMWFVRLRDRSVPLEERLVAFYHYYYESVLTPHWLRLLMYSSLSGLEMAPTYTGTIVKHVIEIVVGEIAHESGRGLPDDLDELTEIGWALHGAVSHLAIRRRIYASSTSMPPEKSITKYVQAFLAGVPTLLPAHQSV
jgi:AcrR family transcriptional regulator